MLTIMGVMRFSIMVECAHDHGWSALAILVECGHDHGWNAFMIMVECAHDHKWDAFPILLECALHHWWNAVRWFKSSRSVTICRVLGPQLCKPLEILCPEPASLHVVCQACPHALSLPFLEQSNLG